MGRGRPGTGVEPLQTCIRIRFQYQNQRCTERLDLEPTPANIKAAVRLVAKVKGQIAHGTFDYAETFPNSPRALQAPKRLFRDYAKAWLGTLTVQKSTRKGYENAIDYVWIPALGDRPVAEIVYSEIAKVVGEKAETASGKTVNNILIPLRKVFASAKADKMIKDLPTAEVHNLPHQSPEPDPFERGEMEKIVAFMKDKYPEQVWNYYEFAFNTGLRPSEQIVVRWADVDWVRRKIKIERARVRFREKGTKTNTVRLVDLNDRAMEALERQKAHTFMKGEEIFENPVSGRVWASEKVQRLKYFYPAQKALGIRVRHAYQTRHTYATVRLMGGIVPAYIAKQLGHKTTAMLFKHYAKWIEGADKGTEAAKVNALFAQHLPTDVANTAETR